MNIDMYPAGNYMFKVNKRKTRPRCEICSKLTIKTPERRHWHRSGVFTVKFEQVNSDYVRVITKTICFIFLRTLLFTFFTAFDFLTNFNWLV